MITDGNLRLATGQAFTTQYGLTTNAIDLSVAMRDVGQGEDLMVNILWTTGCSAAAGTTLNAVVYAGHLPIDASTNQSSGQPSYSALTVSSVTSNVITTSAAHSLVPGTRVRFTFTSFTGVTSGVDYYVRSVPSTTTFDIAATPDGAQVACSSPNTVTCTPQAEIIASSGPQAVTRLATGAAMQLCVNPAVVYPGTNAPRYLCVGYIGSAALSTGTWTVDVALTSGDGRRNYPVGFSVT